MTLEQAHSTHSFENEREILYQILFDLRKDVTELKKMVYSNLHNSNAATTPKETSVAFYSQPQNGTISPTFNVAPETVVNPTNTIIEEVTEADEYIEESLSLNNLEKQTILRALEKNHGRRRNAAVELGISERTLYRKIKEYDLE